MEGFEKLLLYFQFKKVDTSQWKNNKHSLCYEHVYYNWWAEIWDRGGWFEVFMAGQELKHSSCPPGGWVYGTTEEIVDELNAALEKLENDSRLQ